MTPVTFSEWAAPIVPILKTEGTLRLCGDYKVTVNQVLQPDLYLLPRVEDLFVALPGGTVFSKLDLSHAYQQIQLHEDSKKFTTISTQQGLFQYERLPFGIKTAPVLFQTTMETLLTDLPYVCVYIDDILVTGTDEQNHLKNLEFILQRLELAESTLKKSKCVLTAESVEYLGHVIDKNGLHPSPSKVQAIKQAPIHPWEYLNRLWARVHVDHAGPFLGKQLLLLIDAHSKWLEVHTVSSTFSSVTINKLRDVFAIHGIPEQLVSDNGSVFTSNEFRQFMENNGINHTLTSPYHPRSNGLVERAVQTFKQAMRKMDGSLESNVSIFFI